ncbi:MAG: beta-L-arabinofuranosidase domain-containing protein [Lachnospiraceae bacterium]
MLSGYSFGEVELLPGLFKERADVNREYLMGLENQGLLQNFYLEAGIVMPGLQVVDNPETAALHWGWEAPICQLRGHFLGHWLSAASALVAAEQDRELKAKLDTIIDELEKCQKLNGGQWLGSIPEKYFGKLERNEYIWSPQYVMHKTVLGLLHAYQYAGNEKALQLLDRLADWYVAWVKKMAEKNPHAVYSGEEGGMLEVWATLYELTGQLKYRELAEAYAHPSLFEKLLEGKDALTNCHQNASIPFAHGAAKMYEITKEERWLCIVKAFWKNAVTDRGAYCTGGQGSGEYWVPPHMQGRFLSDRNQEFCTVYNMVRLAEYLYRFTGDTLYADYIEKNLYNGFLAQQNKDTGMPTYFLPLRAGSRKKWGSRTRDFWCCHGTMVQAQTLYPVLCYYQDAEKNRLIVSQYIPSKLQFGEGKEQVVIEQSVNMKYYNEQAFFDESDEGQMSRWQLKFVVRAHRRFTVSFRVPGWVKSEPVVMIGGEVFQDYSMENGYLNIERDWREEEISLYFPAGLEFSRLPDIPEMTAVMEGPIVLAGLCEADEGLYMEDEQSEKTFMPQVEHTYSTFPWKQSTYQTLGQPKNLTFVPLYDVTDETYTVYFTKKS